MTSEKNKLQFEIEKLKNNSTKNKNLKQIEKEKHYIEWLSKRMETLEGIINELRTNLHQNNAELQKALIEKQISDSDARTAFLELNTLQEKFSIIKFEESDVKKIKNKK